jgi:hypothetical protein
MVALTIRTLLHGVRGYAVVPVRGALKAKGTPKNGVSRRPSDFMTQSTFGCLTVRQYSTYCPAVKIVVKDCRNSSTLLGLDA